MLTCGLHWLIAALATAWASIRGYRAVIALQLLAIGALTLSLNDEIYLVEQADPTQRIAAPLFALWLALTAWSCCAWRRDWGPEPRWPVVPAAMIVSGQRLRRIFPLAIGLGTATAAVLLIAWGLLTPADSSSNPARQYFFTRMQLLGALKKPVGGHLSLFPLTLRTRSSLASIIHPRSVMLGGNAAMLAMAFVFPVPFAQTIGAHAVVLLAASIMTTFVTAIRQLWASRPWLKAIVFATIVLSYAVDSHEVRCTDCQNFAFPRGGYAARLSQADVDHASRYVGLAPSHEMSGGGQAAADEPFSDLDRAAAKFSGSGTTQSPLVVVATAGGGLRAAYWTATVLGAIQDRNPHFAEQLFAVSAVSGGSLGAAVFRGLIERQRAGYPIRCLTARAASANGFQACGQAVLSHDFLAPVLMGLLFRDAMPLPTLGDRAALLERAWEEAWRSTFPDGATPGLAQRFDRVTAGSLFPALVLNATTTNGERVVVSNLTLPRALINAVEIRPLSLSTAANLSARFPLVEPAGSLLDRFGQYYGQIVDGGYLENFGADSTLDIVDAVLLQIADDDVSNGVRVGTSWRRRLIVIQISSDPALDFGDNIMFSDMFDTYAIDQVSKLTPEPRPSNIAQLWAPISTLLAARATQGNYLALQLIRDARRSEGGYYHFRLLDPDKHVPPLSWSLSNLSFSQIYKSLQSDNGRTLEKLLTILLH